MNSKNILILAVFKIVCDRPMQSGDQLSSGRKVMHGFDFFSFFPQIKIWIVWHASATNALFPEVKKRRKTKI